MEASRSPQETRAGLWQDSAGISQRNRTYRIIYLYKGIHSRNWLIELWKLVKSQIQRAG